MRIIALFFGLSATLGAADEFRIYVDNEPPSRELLASMGRLQSDPAHAGVAWRIIRLGSGAPEASLHSNTILALADGVRYLPTLVLTDEKGSYARVVGAVSTREGRTFSERLAEARKMKTADRQANSQRRLADRNNAEFYDLLDSVSRVDASTDDDAIAQLENRVKQFLERPGTSASTRQNLTLALLYPLALRRYTAAYNGAHTPTSEALFLRAIDLLEQARDMNPNSEAGKKAHAMREELRAARLRAARHD